MTLIETDPRQCWRSRSFAPRGSSDRVLTFVGNLQDAPVWIVLAVSQSFLLTSANKRLRALRTPSTTAQTRKFGIPHVTVITLPLQRRPASNVGLGD